MQDIVDIICVKYLWMLISVSTIHKEKFMSHGRSRYDEYAGVSVCKIRIA